MLSISQNLWWPFFSHRPFSWFNVLFFSVGGANPYPTSIQGGQNPYISTNSQYYHHSFCPKGGPNSIDNFNGGPWPNLPPLDPPLALLDGHCGHCWTLRTCRKLDVAHWIMVIVRIKWCNGRKPTSSKTRALLKPRESRAIHSSSTLSWFSSASIWFRCRNPSRVICPSFRSMLAAQ